MSGTSASRASQSCAQSAKALIGIVFGILSVKIYYGIIGVVGIVSNVLIVLVGLYLLIDQNISN